VGDDIFAHEQDERCFLQIGVEEAAQLRGDYAGRSGLEAEPRLGAAFDDLTCSLPFALLQVE
jgi:hypothetical protein